MSASACAEVAVDLIMAGSTESTKGLIFVNQSDTQPQRGGFRHSNKKSQQHRMQTEPSQQPDFTAINNYNCSSLFASVYFHRSVDTIMSETRGLWCYFASANLLWACNNFITPFYTWHKMCHFQKRVCKVISFSNSKLESLSLCRPHHGHQTFFALLFLLFSFLSLLLPFLLSYHLLSLLTSFVPSFLASLQSFAFPCCFLYSVPSVLSSFLPPFSPSFSSSSPFRISLPSSCLPFFLPWPLPFFLPSLPSSCPPSLLLTIFALILASFLLSFRPFFLLLPSLLPSFLPSLCLSCRWVTSGTLCLMTRLQPLTLLLLEAVGCPPHPHTPPLSLCNQRQPQTDTGLPAPPPEYPQVYKCVCVCGRLKWVTESENLHMCMCGAHTLFYH